MIVISGTIDRSWNSRIEKARSPCGRVELARRAQHRQHLRGRGQASGRPIASAGPRLSRAPADQQRQRQPAQQHLRRPSPKMSRFAAATAGSG
jgi:hypothetical protein